MPSYKEEFYPATYQKGKKKGQPHPASGLRQRDYKKDGTARAGRKSRALNPDRFLGSGLAVVSESAGKPDVKRTRAVRGSKDVRGNVAKMSLSEHQASLIKSGPSTQADRNKVDNDHEDYDDDQGPVADFTEFPNYHGSLPDVDVWPQMGTNEPIQKFGSRQALMDRLQDPNNPGLRYKRIPAQMEVSSANYNTKQTLRSFQADTATKMANAQNTITGWDYKRSKAPKYEGVGPPVSKGIPHQNVFYAGSTVNPEVQQYALGPHQAQPGYNVSTLRMKTTASKHGSGMTFSHFKLGDKERGDVDPMERGITSKKDDLKKQVRKLNQKVRPQVARTIKEGKRLGKHTLTIKEP